MTCDLQYLQSSNNKNSNNATTGPARPGTGPVHIMRKLRILIHIAICYELGSKGIPQKHSTNPNFLSIHCRSSDTLQKMHFPYSTGR